MICLIFLDLFLSWPLWGRAALVLGLFLLTVLLLRVPLLKFLSLIPFLLKWIFRATYLLLEWLFSRLHKLLGGTFYRVDNGLAAFGKCVDGWLERWYGAWSNSKAQSPYNTLMITAVLACYLCIVLPPALHVEEGWQTWGWSAYLRAEDTFIRWIEKQGWGETESPQEPFQMSLTVYRVSSVLTIRDIPSTVGCTTLDTLPNGAVVSWHGELAFGFAEGQQEMWVKVTTDSGVEGWGRLNYLHPEENIEGSLMVTNIFDPASPTPPAE